MEAIKQFIQNAIIETSDNVHSVGYGLKQTKDTYTDQLCIVYTVSKKLPSDQIKPDEIIPKTVTIDGVKYPTDVIQREQAKFVPCYSYDSVPPPNEVLTNRTQQRPISGGLIIGNPLEWSQPSPNSLSYNWGTLGFVAIDNTDNSVVGVTNNHVIIESGFFDSEIDPSLGTYNIIDSKTFNNPPNYILTGIVKPRVLQFSLVYFGGNQYISFDLDASKIGQPKRYYPFSGINSNLIDTALMTLDENVVDFSSTAFNGLDGTVGLDFATTAELNSLIPGGSIIKSSGARTGVKNTDCLVVIDQLFQSLLVSGVKNQGIEQTILFDDAISIRNSDLSDHPIDGGDSGSAVIINVNGVDKIAGLVYAGGTNIGYFCRIDHIASTMNISPWTNPNQTVRYTPSLQNISTFVRPLNDNRVSIQYNNKTYWQVGTTLTTSGDLQI